MPNQVLRNVALDEGAVSLVLEGHHRHLDDLLDRVEMAVDIGSWHEARNGFARFQTELEEHMRIEEDLMFPSFDAFARAAAGPSAILRTEHRQIRELLTVLEELLHDEQPIGDATDALEALLAAHNAKEESILYPLFERHAPPEAYAALDLELHPVTSFANADPLT
jgi:iron-sulfur cluster repair protein YtfE (RIC family)